MQSGTPPSELQSDGSTADQHHVPHGWHAEESYEAYVHQPSMVAPGDASHPQDPFPHYNFQGFATPQQQANADQQAAQFYPNSSNSAYRTSYGPQYPAHVQDAEHVHHFQPAPPMHPHNSALQQAQFPSADLGHPVRDDFQQAHYPGFNFHHISLFCYDY